MWRFGGPEHDLASYTASTPRLSIAVIVVFNIILYIDTSGQRINRYDRTTEVVRMPRQLLFIRSFIRSSPGPLHLHHACWLLAWNCHRHLRLATKKNPQRQRNGRPCWFQGRVHPFIHSFVLVVFDGPGDSNLDVHILDAEHLFDLSTAGKMLIVRAAQGAPSLTGVQSS